MNTENSFMTCICLPKELNQKMKDNPLPTPVDEWMGQWKREN
jgi:hypothetical protein